MGPGHRDDTVRVGITDYAQAALGDVVFVDLPSVGDEVTAGGEFGNVESTKSQSELYAPITAKVVAVNEDLSDSPELVNSDPYGGGWLIDLQIGGDSSRPPPPICWTPTPTAPPSTNDRIRRVNTAAWAARYGRVDRKRVVRSVGRPGRHRHSSQ